MMPLEQASRDIQLWTTLQVINGYLDTKNTHRHRLRSIYDVLKDQIDEHTKGEKEFTVEDFVNYSNKDLEAAGFRRHGEPNEKGEVLYLIPIVLYLVMPEELVVFDIDDEARAFPKTMAKLLVSMGGEEEIVPHGIVVQSDIDDAASGPDHEAIRALFKQANHPYEPGDDTNLSVTYDKGLVTLSVTTENYGGYRYNATCEIDARGQKFELGSFIYIMDSVEDFLDSIEHMPINYDDFDAWKVRYLEAVHRYLVR